MPPEQRVWKMNHKVVFYSLIFCFSTLRRQKTILSRETHLSLKVRWDWVNKENQRDVVFQLQWTRVQQDLPGPDKNRSSLGNTVTAHVCTETQILRVLCQVSLQYHFGPQILDPRNLLKLILLFIHQIFQIDAFLSDYSSCAKPRDTMEKKKRHIPTIPWY